MSETNETDRELLDRLLPRWWIEELGRNLCRVAQLWYIGPYGSSEEDAVTKAAFHLRRILARDRETRAEKATATESTTSEQRIIAGLTELRDQAAAGAIPCRMVRAEHLPEVRAMQDAAILNNRFPGWTLEGSPDDLCRVVTHDRRGPWAVTGRDAIRRAADQIRELEAKHEAEKAKETTT